MFLTGMMIYIFIEIIRFWILDVFRFWLFTILDAFFCFCFYDATNRMKT